MATALIIGLALEIAIGRRWAERARTLHDMRQGSTGRRRYRG